MTTQGASYPLPAFRVTLTFLSAILLLLTSAHRVAVSLATSYRRCSGIVKSASSSGTSSAFSPPTAPQYDRTGHVPQNDDTFGRNTPARMPLHACSNRASTYPSGIDSNSTPGCNPLLLATKYAPKSARTPYWRSKPTKYDFNWRVDSGLRPNFKSTTATSGSDSTAPPRTAPAKGLRVGTTNTRSMAPLMGSPPMSVMIGTSIPGPKPSISSSSQPDSRRQSKYVWRYLGKKCSTHSRSFLFGPPAFVML